MLSYAPSKVQSKGRIVFVNFVQLSLFLQSIHSILWGGMCSVHFAKSQSNLWIILTCQGLSLFYNCILILWILSIFAFSCLHRTCDHCSFGAFCALRFPSVFPEIASIAVFADVQVAHCKLAICDHNIFTHTILPWYHTAPIPYRPHTILFLLSISTMQ